MTQTTQPRTLWRLLLVGSLAVNLLLIGLIGGAYLRTGGAPPRGYELQLGPLSNALSREDRRTIGERLRREVDQAGTSRRDRRAAFDALVSAVEAQPFDPERLALLITEQQNRTDTIRAAAFRTFIDHLTEMSAEERQVLAQNLRESVKKFQEGSRRSPGPRPSSGG